MRRMKTGLCAEGGEVPHKCYVVTLRTNRRETGLRAGRRGVRVAGRRVLSS